MRIDGINKVNNVYKNNKANKVYSAANITSSKDTVAISDFAKELQIAKQAVSNTPDVRQTKLDEIKKLMEAGNYEIAASDVAGKLVDKYFE